MAAIDGGKVKSRILHARLLAPQRCHHDIAADALLRPPAPRSIRAVSADRLFVLVHQRDRRVHCLWEAHARLYRHCDMAADAGLPLQHGRAQRGIRAVSADRQRERRVHCLYMESTMNSENVVCIASQMGSTNNRCCSG